LNWSTPRTIGTISCPLTQRHARPQMIGQQNASAASTLSQTQPVDGHVIGISRSKKPEQAECRESARSQFYSQLYSQGSAFRDADRLREQNLDTDRHQPLSTVENVQSAFQAVPSTTSSTTAISISSHIQQPDQTKDSSQPSSPMSFISREAPQCESPTSSGGAFACVSQSDSASSSQAAGSSGIWNPTVRQRIVRPTMRSQSLLPSFSLVTSTRGASTHHSATGIVYAPRSTRVSLGQAVGGADHSLFKPGHHSLPALRRGGDSSGTAMGWRVSSGSMFAEMQAEMCLGTVYFFALLWTTPQGKKMSGMFPGAVLAAALFVLSLFGSAWR